MDVSKYTIKNIRRGSKLQGRDHIVYATLHDENDNLFISATLEYIVSRLEEMSKTGYTQKG